jgi:hypothetical protein
MYPFAGAGDAGLLGTRQVVSSIAAVVNPWLTRSYRCACVISEGVHPCSAIV